MNLHPACAVNAQDELKSVLVSEISLALHGKSQYACISFNANKFTKRMYCFLSSRKCFNFTQALCKIILSANQLKAVQFV